MMSSEVANLVEEGQSYDSRSGLTASYCDNRWQPSWTNVYCPRLVLALFPYWLFSKVAVLEI